MNQLTKKVQVIHIVHSGTDGNDGVIGIHYLTFRPTELHAQSCVGHAAHTDYISAALTE